MKKLILILLFVASKLSLGQVTIEFKLVPGSTKTLNGNIVLCNNTGAALPAGYYIDFFWPGFNIKDLSGAVGSASKPSTNVTRLKFETWMLPANGQCKTISVSSESTYGDDFLFPAFGTDSKGNKVTVVATDPKFIPQAYNAEPKEFYIQKDCFISSPSSLCLGEAQFEEWNRVADVRVPSNRKGWALAAAHAHRMFTNMMGCEVTSLNFAFATSMIEGRMGCDAGFLPPTGDNNPLTYEGHIGVDGCFQIRPLGWVQLEDFYPHIFTNLSKAPITDNGNFITACLSKTLYDFTSFQFWDQYFCYPKVKEFLCNMKDPYGGDAMFAYMYHKGWNHSDFYDVFGANRNTWINSNNIANLLATKFPDINGGYAERVRNNIMRLENNVNVAGGPSLVVGTAQENWDPANYEYHGCYDEAFTWTDISNYIDEACRVFINADKAAVKAAAQIAFNNINGGAAVNFSKLGAVIDAIVLAIPLPSATRGMAGKYFSQAELCSKGNIRIKSYDKICVGQNAQMNVYLFGVPPFSYSIMAPDGSVFSKSGVTVPTDYYTINQPGEYKIISFSDANGAIEIKCNVARTIVENAGNATVKWNKVGVSNGCASGALQVDLTGTAPFTIKYKEPSGVEKTVLINSNSTPYTVIASPVPSGTYVLTHLTAGGCDGPLNDSIKFCTNTCIFPSATISGNKDICNGDSALITVALKGTAPFKIKYSNGINKYIQSNINSNSYSFYTKAAGTYKVDSVWDALCDTIGKGSAVVTIKNSPTITMSGDTSFCAGASTNISFNYTGTAPYTVWFIYGTNAFPYTSNLPFYNMAITQTGVHTFTVTDATSCKSSIKTNIISLAPPTLTMNNKIVGICAGSNSTLVGTATGGTGNYTYAWSGKASGNNNSFIATSDGLHILQVTDSKGCKDIDTVRVNYSAALPVNLLNDTICAGDSVVISSGYIGAGYSYLWNTGETTTSITAKKSALYSVTVNNNGCSGTGSMNLLHHSKPIVNLGTDKNICSGNTITIDAGNGFSSYSWNGQAQNSSSYSTSLGGIYVVEVSDMNACKARDTINITVIEKPSPSLLNDVELCVGGSHNFDVSSYNNGNGPYAYKWHNNSTTSKYTINDAANNSVVFVDITDKYGCVGRDGALIKIKNSLNVQISSSDSVFCEGEVATLSSNFAQNNAYDFSWSTGEKNATINITNNGKVNLTVKDPDGCEGSDEISLLFLPMPKINAIADSIEICEGESVILDALNSGFNFFWNTKQTSQSIEVNKAGNYSVKISKDKCSSTANIVVNEIVLPRDFILSSSASSVLCFEDEEPISIGTAPIKNATYSWNTGETSANILVEKEGDYILTINQGNCLSKDSITFGNFCESTFYVPNAFTPYGDGKNEIFKVKGKHLQDFEMLIFNRWGELIFQSNDMNEGWNGSYMGNPVQQDVYVYKIVYSVQQSNGKKIKQQRIGTVSPIF